MLPGYTNGSEEHEKVPGPHRAGLPLAGPSRRSLQQCTRSLGGSAQAGAGVLLVQAVLTECIPQRPISGKVTGAGYVCFFSAACMLLHLWLFLICRATAPSGLLLVLVRRVVSFGAAPWRPS